MRADTAFLQPEAKASGQSRTLIIFAHPDDETVGMGATLSFLPEAWFVCVTNGSPPDPADAKRSGCASREDYAALRKRELVQAVTRAGYDPARLSFLDFGDQRASLHLAEIAQALEELIEKIRPRRVITQPYEGGHPDHDATAFAVHSAVALRRARGAEAIPIIEMTAYHRRGCEMEFGSFLPSCNPVITLPLDAAARARKQELLDCHASQTHVLGAVPLVCERFRDAPQYDFLRPPHEGVLLYEQFPWGMDGERWRECAIAALEKLNLRTSAITTEKAEACSSLF